MQPYQATSQQNGIRYAYGRITRPVLIIIGLLLVAGTSTAFALRAYNHRRATAAPRKPASAPPVNTAPLTPARQQTNDAIEGELVTVHPYGFEPTQITRPQGQFVLVLENRSQLVGSLQFSLASAASVTQWAAPQGIPDGDRIFDLSPGQYVLTEANHPKWICNITITSK